MKKELCFPSFLLVWVLTASCCGQALAANHWEPAGLSGGGGMFSPAISPANSNLMMINCDMSGAYISEDGGRNWRMIHQAQLRSDTHCRPAFHPTNPDIIYASSGGRLKISRDRGKTFSAIGNLKEGLFGEIAFDPSRPSYILAGSRNGGCWYSQDAGVTWLRCDGPVGQVIGFFIEQVTAKGPMSWVATDKGIWRSDFPGTKWSDATQGLPWKEIQGFAGGSSWKSRNPSFPIFLYCTIRSKVENGVLKGGVYRCKDLANWESAMGQGINTETQKADQYAFGPIAQYHQIFTADAKPLTVYAFNTGTGFHPPHHETVYRSDDGGEHWRAVYFQDPRFKEYNVAPDYVTASTGQSYKGGETPFGAAICNSDPERLILVINEPHITHDGGKTWLAGHTYPAPGQQPKPGCAWVCNGLVVTTTWNYYIDPFETNRHYIAYTDIGMVRSLDAGKSWIWWDPKSWPPWRNTCYEMAFDPETPGKIWSAFSDVHDIPNDNIISERHGHNRPGGVCISRDFGATWKHEASGLPPKPLTSIVLDPNSANNNRTLYAGVFDEGVFKSIDDGKTWTLKKTGLGHPDNMRVYRVVLHQDGALFAIICARRPGPRQPLLSAGVGLYRSRDGAETWEKINATQPLLYVKDFSVHPRDSRKILMGACDAGGGDQSGGLYRTEDGGQTWQRIGRQGPQTFGGYYHPKRDGWIYMTLTEGAPGPGLWLTQNNGQTWQPINELPFSNIQRVTFDPFDDARIYVTTFGGSVWKGPAGNDQ